MYPYFGKHHWETLTSHQNLIPCYLLINFNDSGVDYSTYNAVKQTSFFFFSYCSTQEQQASFFTLMIACGVSRWIFLSARCLCLVCWWVNLFRNKASIQVHYCTIDFRSRRWAGTPYWIFMNTLCLRPHGRSTGTKEIILKGISATWSAKFAKDKEWDKYSHINIRIWWQKRQLEHKHSWFPYQAS